MWSQIEKNPISFFLGNCLIVFLFINTTASLEQAIETLLTSIGFALIPLIAGGIYTFVFNIFTGKSLDKNLWGNWWKRASFRAVIVGLIVLNIFFIFGVIIYLGENVFDM